MVTIHPHSVAQEAVRVPYVTADEAFSLLSIELERLLALLETLDPQDWSRPTACTLWDIRDMVAHQAGGYASGTSYQEMLRQYFVIPKRGQLPEDAINARQLAERAGKSPAELIAELRQVGPVAIKKWAYQFRLAKLISIPHAVAGSLSLRHLMWVIHSRDTWMHRLDICRATQRKFEQTAEQDGRIAALVMLDVEKTLRGKLGEQAVVFDLSGVAGGVWKIGAGKAAATIHMDVLDFNIFASGRFRYEEARPRASLSGDIALVVHQPPDLVQVELRGGVRVEHGGVVDMVALAGQGGLDRQRLYVDICQDQRRQVRGEQANMRGLDSVSIHQAGNLHTASLW
jgi:uncharacterized protein (TIGR03083 family)